MQKYLCGVRRLDMMDDEGRKVQGFSCFIGCPAADVEGDEVSKVFVSDAMAQQGAWHPMVSSRVNVDFTPKGRLSFVSAVKEK